MIEHRLILPLVAIYNGLVLALVSFVVTLLITAHSFFSKVRMSHENGIALRGRLRIAADARMPQHDFFEQGRTFACRIRHGAASFTDDAKLVVRSASIKFADSVGKVDYIGLRSTRIRTLDRTVLSVPNGQIANASVETLSARDKFWFHHVIGLRYETTSGQMRAIIDGTRAYLAAYPMTDQSESVRSRFVRFSPFSLDIEMFAYVYARDWDAFLETQQELLLEIMNIVERAGAEMALPSQTLHLADGSVQLRRPATESP